MLTIFKLVAGFSPCMWHPDCNSIMFVELIVLHAAKVRSQLFKSLFILTVYSVTLSHIIGYVDPYMYKN